MTSACTLLCPAINFQRVLEVTRAVTEGEVILDGTSDEWSRITVLQLGERLILSSLVRERPGDKFSKLVLSMHNYFRTVETQTDSNKRFVLSRIENAELMIGVVAEPPFLKDDWRLDVLWSIADCMDALIFNGEAMLEPQGRRILDRKGEYDVLV